MSALKVGDKVVDKSGNIATYRALIDTTCVLSNDNGCVWVLAYWQFKMRYTPYTEPVPVKRIVGLANSRGGVRLAFEGSDSAGDFTGEKRIEITPEMLFGEKK